MRSFTFEKNKIYTMKKSYFLLLAFLSATAFAQQTISFEAGEGYQLGTLHEQNGWEVTEGSDGFLQNQVLTDAFSSQGNFSFKNAYEPSFDAQWFPIFGASKTFDEPMDYRNLTFSYDVLVNQKLGADFEFTLFAINESDEFVPVAGVGIENRGMIYLIKDENYGFDYAAAEWIENTWINVKIEVTENEVKYYINNVLQNTIANFTQLNVVGFNMLHNNYGNDAYYDNFVITTGALNTKPFENNAISVYPNPIKDDLSIALPNGIELSETTIFNLAGQKVLTTNQNQNINVSQLSVGIYILKATSTNGATFTQKIIKN